MQFIARIELLTLKVDAPARVVINERTGTVVLGSHFRIATVAVAHGNLTIQVKNETEVSQPGAFAPRGAETVVVPKSDVQVKEEKAQARARARGGEHRGRRPGSQCSRCHSARSHLDLAGDSSGRRAHGRPGHHVMPSRERGRLGARRGPCQGRPSSAGEELQAKASARIRKAAKDFEAILAEQLLKTARRSSSRVEPLPRSPGREIHEGMADEQLARAMTRGRGLGLGDFLADQVLRQTGTKSLKSGPHPADRARVRRCRAQEAHDEASIRQNSPKVGRDAIPVDRPAGGVVRRRRCRRPGPPDRRGAPRRPRAQLRGRAVSAAPRPPRRAPRAGRRRPPGSRISKALVASGRYQVDGRPHRSGAAQGRADGGAAGPAPIRR